MAKPKILMEGKLAKRKMEYDEYKKVMKEQKSVFDFEDEKKEEKK